MEMNNLLQFVKKESARLVEKYPCNNMDPETYARAVKLVEEVGELFAEILKSSSLQRKEKLSSDEDLEDNLSDEFADVILTTLLLAERMKIKIDKALEIKIAKIKERH